MATKKAKAKDYQTGTGSQKETPSAPVTPKEEKPEVKETPPVKEVIVTEPTRGDLLSDSRNIKVVKNGHEVEMTSDAITIAIRRGDKIEIPKGSKYIPPADEEFDKRNNCKGCGR